MAWFCGLFVLLTACAPAQPRGGQESKQAIVITGVVIRNDLAYPVADVMIEVPATGSFAGCGTILPRTECSNAFQPIDYRANPVVVRWKEHGEPQQTDEFNVSLPPGALPGDALRVEVGVFAPGQAGARLVGEEPGAIRNR